MYANEAARDYKGAYLYRQSAVLSRSWMIYCKDHRGDLVPVGDYTVLDREEHNDISEKKLINLMALLNDSDDLLQVGDKSSPRLLFQRKPKLDRRDPDQVIFYTYTGDGVSKENAILTLDPGVADRA